MIEETYRRAFQSERSAARYDEIVYRSGSSADILWGVESDIIRSLAIKALSGKTKTSYLDFACGTGRIVSHLENLADRCVGVDVSSSMLERARSRCTRAHFICGDITNGAAGDTQYDLITAFRFLTNAEDALRFAALAALYDRLKDDGTLLINTHGNPFSYRLLLLPYHWLKDRLAGRTLFGYISRRKTQSLLCAAGFRIEAVVGMGFVPEKTLGFVGETVAAWLEKHLAGVPIIQRFGLNQLFICRKA